MNAHVRDTPLAYDIATAQAPAANTDATYHDLFSALRALLLCYQLNLPQLEALLASIESDPRPIERITLGELLALIAQVQS